MDKSKPPARLPANLTIKFAISVSGRYQGKWHQFRPDGESHFLVDVNSHVRLAGGYSRFEDILKTDVKEATGLNTIACLTGLYHEFALDKI
jgi:hypothetical protein